jgi:leucyl-tRNA synthetase
VAAEPEVTLVIQVAGRVRDRATVPVGTTEAQALEASMKSEKVRAALNGRAPSKVIYVQDRLINLVP